MSRTILRQPEGAATHASCPGLVCKTVQSTMPPRTSYELTEAGRALAPIIVAIAAWGERYLPDETAACEEG